MPTVVVDWNRCSGKDTCVEVCPVNVFEFQEYAMGCHPFMCTMVERFMRMDTQDQV